MSEQQKNHHGEGHPFFPGHILLEAMVMLGTIIVLMIGAVLIELPHESVANPTDTSYIPRPDWYFMFLFQALKYFPGSMEVFAAIVLPGVSIGVLLFLPFLDKNPARHPKKRPLATSSAIVTLLGIVILTILGFKDGSHDSNIGSEISFFEKWKYGVIIAIIFINFIVTWILVGKNSPVKDGASKMITASVLTVLSIIGLSTVFVFSAIQQPAAGPSADTPGAKGAASFEATCGGCHKAHGKGAGTIDLTDKVKGKTADQIMEIVKTNPAMASVKDNPELKDITEFLASGGGASAPAAEGTAPATTEGAAPAGGGAASFEATCGGCHKAHGKGAGTIDLTDKIKGKTAEQIVEIVKTNPAMAGVKDNPELKAITEFLAGGGGAAAPAPAATATADGAALFERNCGGCHKANGKGAGTMDLTEKGKAIGASGVLGKINTPPPGMVVPADINAADKQAMAEFVAGKK
jgi:mono/diheme cytochrome c family protein